MGSNSSFSRTKTSVLAGSSPSPNHEVKVSIVTFEKEKSLTHLKGAEFTTEEDTFEPANEALVHLLPLPLHHALVKVGNHGRLEDQDLHGVDRRWALLLHKVHNRLHHGIRHHRWTGPSLTYQGEDEWKL